MPVFRNGLLELIAAAKAFREPKVNFGIVRIELDCLSGALDGLGEYILATKRLREQTQASEFEGSRRTAAFS